MTIRLRALCLGALIFGSALPAVCAAAGPSAADASPAWGAIASNFRAYGFSYDHASREAAERAAREQCNRSAGRTGPCEIRLYFSRACGALAVGNYGEWGTAIAANSKDAGSAAVTQCNAHLPTEPCKLQVAQCSPR